MASSTIDLLIGRLISLLENQASILSNVHHKINETKLELLSLRSFLDDADKVGEHSERQEVWVASIREVAYDVEDILDEFIYQVNKQRQWRGNYSISRFFHGFSFHAPKELWARRRVAAKLRDILKRIKSIPERSRRYGVHGLEGLSSGYDPSWVKYHGESSLFFRDEDLVGMQKAKQALMGWLVSEELHRSVVSVVGMGGSGKTTLVANIFNNQIVKKHFDFCGWITISQDYVIEDLFRTMMKEVRNKANQGTPVELSSMSYRQMLESLVNFMHPRKYFIVLDDVWSINLWQQIKIALPDGMRGSRVMLTTRKEDIASFQFGATSYVHQLQPLEKDEAWALFCMKAFPSNLNMSPSSLDSIARCLVRKCQGLPLAVATLGGLMSTKSMVSEWRKVQNNLNWELSNNPGLEVVKSVLLLSYHHLPYRLKQCFLYCCTFPEDYKIRRKRLIRLWVAEGFAEQVRGSAPEEVADGYLMELIYRNLLHVAERNEWGRPKACKMHDLLRELALSISERENLVVVSDGRKLLEGNRPRRLSIEARGSELKLGNGSQLRSLFVFSVDRVPKSSISKLPPGFRLLRVLDLEDAPFDELPIELVGFFNLRYLNLTGTQVKQLPSSIGKLCNLETLDIKESKIEELPTGIDKLQKLQHLIMYRIIPGELSKFNLVVGTCTPENIYKLKSLQVMTTVKAEGDIIKRLKNMTQLKRIGLTKVRQKDEKDLCCLVENIKDLHHLFVQAIDEEEPLQMEALPSAPRLEKLYLSGKLQRIPHWFNSVQNLTYLSLHWSRLEEDFLPHIYALPNLAKLVLIHAYQGERLHFLQGFQKLKYLYICRCPQLSEFVIAKGVMPGLQKLYLWECDELKTLPQGLENLVELKEFYFSESSDEIIDHIHEEGKANRSMIRDILGMNQNPSGFVKCNGDVSDKE